MSKPRLDQHIITLGLCETAPRAKALIMTGAVLVNEVPQTKSGFLVPDGALVRLKASISKEHRWVSRGALKLLGGIEAFQPPLSGATVIDVGAATGGFTEVLLHHGAAKVYAVDVGYGILDWKMRKNPCVVVLEKTNARDLTEAQIPEPVDGVVCDASFISLSSVLPVPLRFVRPGGFVLALIKPQFEAAYADIAKGGIVRDDAVRARLVTEMTAWLNAQAGWQVRGVCDSPITGQDGNLEYLLYATLTGAA